MYVAHNLIKKVRIINNFLLFLRQPTFKNNDIAISLTTNEIYSIAKNATRK